MQLKRQNTQVVEFLFRSLFANWHSFRWHFFRYCILLARYLLSLFGSLCFYLSVGFSFFGLVGTTLVSYVSCSLLGLDKSLLGLLFAITVSFGLLFLLLVTYFFYVRPLGVLLLTCSRLPSLFLVCGGLFFRSMSCINVPFFLKPFGTSHYLGFLFQVLPMSASRRYSFCQLYALCIMVDSPLLPHSARSLFRRSCSSYA